MKKQDDSPIVPTLTEVLEGTAGTGVIFRASGGGLEHCDEAEESQSTGWTGEGLFWGAWSTCGSTEPLRIIASSCAWARRRAVCMAMTRWRSLVRRHFSHLHVRYLQYRLWPLRAIFMRWLRQRAQLGGVRGEADVLDAFTSIFESSEDMLLHGHSRRNRFLARAMRFHVVQPCRELSVLQVK